MVFMLAHETKFIFSSFLPHFLKELLWDILTNDSVDVFTVSFTYNWQMVRELWWNLPSQTGFQKVSIHRHWCINWTETWYVQIKPFATQTFSLAARQENDNDRHFLPHEAVIREALMHCFLVDWFLQDWNLSMYNSWWQSIHVRLSRQCLHIWDFF